jgi:hypothetical protein
VSTSANPVFMRHAREGGTKSPFSPRDEFLQRLDETKEEGQETSADEQAFRGGEPGQRKSLCVASLLLMLCACAFERKDRGPCRCGGWEKPSIECL